MRFCSDGWRIVRFAALCGLVVGAVDSRGQQEAVSSTQELQAKIDRASARGGGTVELAAGRYVVAQLELKSNVTLSLAKDAVLVASTDYRDYDIKNVPAAPEGRLAVVCAYGATNIALVGEGRLEGRGDRQTVRKGDGDDRWRMIHFRDCNGVRVEGVSICDSNFWCSFYERCRHVTVRRVKIFSHANGNNDGIDLEVADSLIEDCDIDCGDDAICFKSHDPGFVIENVEVRNCRVASQCNFIKFGTAGHGTCRNIDVHDCTLRRPSPERLHDWAKAGRLGVTDGRWGISAIALEMVDGGSMERVKVRDIDIEGGPQNPLFIRLARRNASKGRQSFIRDILVENVRWKAEDPALAAVLPVVIMGTPDFPVGRVTVRNLRVPFKALKRPPDKRRCRVANRDADYPEVIHISEYYPSWATYLEYAPMVTFENCDFRLLGEGDDRPKSNDVFASERINEEFLGISVGCDDVGAALRPETLALMREMGVGIVRWPVGTEESAAIGACNAVGAEASFTVDPIRENADKLVSRLAKCNRRVTRWLMDSGSAKTDAAYVQAALDGGGAMLKSDSVFPLRLVTDGAYPRKAAEQAFSRLKPFGRISNCASVRSYATEPVARAKSAADAMSAIDRSFAELHSMREIAPSWIRLSLDSVNLPMTLSERDDPANGVLALHALHRIFENQRRLAIDHACPFAAFSGGTMAIREDEVSLTSVGRAVSLAKGHVGGVPMRNLKLPDNVFGTAHGDHLYYTMFNADGQKSVEVVLPEGCRIRLAPYEIQGKKILKPSLSALSPMGNPVKLANLADYTIVIPKDAANTTVVAAEVLARGIERISGVRLEIERGAPSKKNCFAFNPRPMEVDQGYRLTVKNGNVGITGSYRGPYYAVVALLEEDWGVRWFGKDDEAPEYPKLAPDAFAVVPRKYVPPFLGREPLHVTMMRNPEFTAFNRLMPVSYFVKVPEKYGGGIANDFFCHTYDRIVPGQKYFREHPEYYPLIDGKRYDGGQEGGQLCFTAPGLEDVFVDAFESMGAKYPSSVIFSATANDNLFATCQCPECQAIIREEKLVGAEIHLANRIARKVKKLHPDWIVNTWAYSNTAEPPATMKPESNVAMFYAPIADRAGADQYVPWREQKDRIDRQLGEWLKRTSKFMVWDYALLANEPLPNFEVIADNARYWREKGALTVLLEQQEFTVNSLDSMKTWVFTKLFWNPDWDVLRLMEEFVCGFYGKAASFMREYVAVQMSAYRALKERGKPGDDLFLSETDVSRMRGLLAQAYASVADDPRLAARVAREYCAFLVVRLRACRPDGTLQFEKDLALIRELANRHDIVLDDRNPQAPAAVKNLPQYAKWEKRLVAAKGGESAVPRYSRGSFVMTERSVWCGAERVEDPKALGGRPAKMSAKMDWGVQWDFDELMSGQVNQTEYVVRARVRADIRGDHRAEDKALGLHVCRKGSHGAYPGAAVTFADLPRDGWGYVYFFRVFMYTPSGSGYFYNTSEQLSSEDSVLLDYVEAIPAKDFKDSRLLESLPRVVL